MNKRNVNGTRPCWHERAISIYVGTCEAKRNFWHHCEWLREQYVHSDRTVISDPLSTIPTSVDVTYVLRFWNFSAYFNGRVRETTNEQLHAAKVT